jgi:hypothetical protein
VTFLSSANKIIINTAQNPINRSDKNHTFVRLVVVAVAVVVVVEAMIA